MLDLQDDLRMKLVKVETTGKFKRIRVSFEGMRYVIAIPVQHHNNQALITQLQQVVTTDLQTFEFDTTLKKYKRFFTNPAQVQHATKSDVAKLYAEYTKAVGIDLESSYHHFGTYKMLERLASCSLENLPSVFGLQVMSPSTFNKRKTHLKQFYDWLVRIGWLRYNSINDLKSRPVSKSLPDNHIPFTPEQIVQILNAIKTDQFCHKRNQFKHSYYYHFIKFIFHTGVRVGEAAGLRVANLNLTERTARIDTSYGHKTKRWGKTRQFNTAKADSVRTIQLTDEICRDLTHIVDRSKSSDLVFKGPRGKPIDSNNFNDRVFFPVLDGLHIPRRVIYAGRHTYVSLAVDQQVSLSELQQQVGHKSINTTIRYYSLFRRSPNVNVTIPSDERTSGKDC